jgi:hypothetical protein
LIVNNTIPTSKDVSIHYTGDLIIKHPNSINISAMVTQESDISIGDLSLIEVDFEVSMINNDGTTNLIGNFITQCDANGNASTILTFDIGVYFITARIIFEDDYLPAEDFAIVPVYFPNGSFASGGGWIEVTVPDEGNPGRANFGFIAKYEDDQTKGNLEFQYKDGNINLKSKQIEWLVISNVSAQFEGIGSIKGREGLFTFRINCTDNEGNPNEDKFTIKIWKSTDTQEDPIYKALNQNLKGGDIIVKK